MTRPLRTLIVDDEPIARELLRSLLAREPDVEVIGECADGVAALERMRAEPPDLALLDVQMPGLSGIDVAERLDRGRRPAVVFVTAHDEYAVRAFDVHSVDYLLKPVDPARLAEALDRCREALARDGSEDEDGWLLVRRGEARVPLRCEEIVSIEAAGNYVTVHTPGGEYLLRSSLAALEERLNGATFVRIHRGTLVNVARIVSIRPAGHGDHRVKVAGGRELTMSRRYRAGLEALLGAL